MAQAGYDALIVPRADEYLGEYIPAHNERLQWISGFNGSAGVVIVLPQGAAIFVDGRYTVQVRQEVSPDLFEYHHLTDEPHIQWLVGQLPKGARVACDPRMHSFAWHSEALRDLGSQGIDLIDDSDNLIDRSWIERPEPVVTRAMLLAQKHSGESSQSKRKRIGALIAAAGADAALIFAPDSVSWLLNLRGLDIPCSPVVQSFAVLTANGSVRLFVNPDRVPAGLAEHVGPDVDWLPESEAESEFQCYRDQRIMVDSSAANAWTALALQRAGATLLVSQDPVVLPKACKNSVEVQGARSAHIRDAVAEVKFLAWLDAQVAAGQLHNEAELADKLYSLRRDGEYFQDSSFDTISAAGANAAMCHYNHRNTDPARLQMNSVYLVDSGAQYLDGTTDITRTVAIGEPGEEVCRMFTLVLKGHIALAQARFPAGTSGTQLDVLARQFLWQHGCDYDHGTGHGVGSFLSVHEGPQRIAKKGGAVALQPGMIISNEPGYYRDGCFGIRCENLVVVQPLRKCAGETPVMEFETITLAPFDQRLIVAALLSSGELDWLNAYHLRVRDTLEPLLHGGDRDWLNRATAAITG